MYDWDFVSDPGKSLRKRACRDFCGTEEDRKNNRIWLVLPGAFGVGMLAFGWVTYLIAWAASAAGADKPLIYGNLLTMAAGAVFLLGIYIQRYRKNKRIFTDKGLVEDKQLFWKELIFFLCCLYFLPGSYSMYFT